MPQLMIGKKHAASESLSMDIAGKRRFFGEWKGKEYSPHRKYFEAAIDAAKKMDINVRDLQEDPRYSDEGRLEQIREDAFVVLKERAGVLKRCAAARERAVDKAAKALQSVTKDVDVHSLAHQRLIEAYRALPREQKARITQPSFAKQSPELVAALCAEPQIVTGLRADQLQEMRMNLLDDEQRAALAQVDEEVTQIATVERAYNETANVVQVLAELTDGDRAALEEAALEDARPPRPTGSFAGGGILKLVEED